MLSLRYILALFLVLSLNVVTSAQKGIPNVEITTGKARESVVANPIYWLVLALILVIILVVFLWRMEVVRVNAKKSKV